jgi:hypothetical protein
VREYYHCTRLLPDEVKAIESEGLKPASHELLLSKLRSAGLTPTELKEMEGRFDAGPHSGLLTFFNRKADLQKVELVDAYFRYWGGMELLKDALDPRTAATYRGLAHRRQADVQKVELVDAYFQYWGGMELLKDALDPRTAATYRGLAHRSLEQQSVAYIIIVESDELKIDPQRQDQSYAEHAIKVGSENIVGPYKTSLRFWELTPWRESPC